MKNPNQKKTTILTAYIHKLKAFWNYVFLLYKREQYPTLISRDAKQRLKILREISLIDLSTKNLIYSRIRYYFVRLAWMDYWREWFIGIRYFLYNIACIIFVFLFEKIAVQLFEINLWRYLPTLEHIIGYISVATFLFSFLKMWDFLANRITVRVRMILVGITYLMSSVIFLYMSFLYWHHSLNLKMYLSLMLSFGITGALIIMITSIFIDFLIRLISNRIVNYRYPNAIIAFNLLIVLKKIENLRGEIWETEFKRWATTRLEYAARSVERDLFQKLRTHDQQTNKWVQDTMIKVAQALREKKKWLYTPKEDTSDFLADSLTRFLVALIRGNWDSLEQADLPKVELKNIWRGTVMQTINSIIITILLFGVVFWLKYWQNAPSLVVDYGTSFALLWAITNILWTFDPSFKDKVGIMKDIANFTEPKK